ncbi:MAG: hypothetical protein EBZ47_05515 [Chlamydiae bacterium]|nr:hypothetical protein [Chlamydiota bacterium]
MHLCPCGSLILFTECCKPLLDRTSLAQSAKQLMRSRYTAFTLADVNYLKATMKKKALSGFHKEKVKNFALSVHWEGLEVISSHEDESGEVGEVEFVARFSHKKMQHRIHELSKFEKIDGKWYYVEGIHLD